MSALNDSNSAYESRPQDSRPHEAVVSTRVRGALKWFNVVRGYGFISSEDSSGDVFLHMTVLRQAGYEKLPPGTTIECDAVRGAKGMQALQIINVDTSTAIEEDDAEGPDVAGMPVPSGRGGDFHIATVKWFNPHKGYGFVCPDEMEEADVFVHMVTVRRAGLAGLVTGQVVEIRMAEGPKGLQATEIRLS
jgi:cold shock protein